MYWKSTPQKKQSMELVLLPMGFQAPRLAVATIIRMTVFNDISPKTL